MEASELPRGTVTLLFTDVEGSTRLLETLGNLYGDARAEHGRLVRAAFRAGGGVEVDTQGDSFFVETTVLRDRIAAPVSPRSIGKLGYAGGAGPLQARFLTSLSVMR